MEAGAQKQEKQHKKVVRRLLGQNLRLVQRIQLAAAAKQAGGIEERFRQLSDKVDKNKMAGAEMAAELLGLKAGEERRGSDASQTGDCCMEEL